MKMPLRWQHVIEKMVGVYDATAGAGFASLDSGGKIPDGQIPAAIARDAEVAAAYLPLTQKGAASGVAALDANTRLDGAQGGVIAGTLAFYAQSTAPAGWLKANGAAVLIASYPVLAAAIYCGDGLNGTALFGFKCTNPADPTASRSTAGTYIVLPDMRGEFCRGWDDARGIDSGRTFGTAQADAFQGHLRRIKAPDYVDTIASDGGTNINGAQIARGAVAGVNYWTTSGYYTEGSYGSPRVAAETRSRNLALLACIKY